MSRANARTLNDVPSKGVARDGGIPPKRTGRTATVPSKLRLRSADELTTEAIDEVVELTEQALQAPAALEGIDLTWAQFKALQASSDNPTELERLRNALIEHYLHIVKFNAERLRMKLPSEVDVDDLNSAGLFGLMDAIKSFEPSRGVKFETFCAQRVKGAIYDELRSMDWVPRLVRARTAKVERIRKDIQGRIGRKPTDEEVRSESGMSTEEFDKVVKDSRPVGTVSLNRKWFESDSNKDVREIDVIEDNRQTDPLQCVSKSDLKLLLTKGLSRAERLIVVLYYYEEMTMKEIGLTLDLSESRVSQMHSSILARMKAQMQHRMKDL